MSWLSVNKNGSEYIFDYEPDRRVNMWFSKHNGLYEIQVPEGTIEKIIGTKMTWEDDAINLDEFMKQGNNI